MPQAYDAFLIGMRHLHEARRQGGGIENSLARSAFEAAIKADPAYAEAYAGLAWTYWSAFAFGLGGRLPSLERAWQLARRSMEIANNALAQRLLSKQYLDPEAEIYQFNTKKDHEAAVAEARKAIAIEPNNADALAELAYILVFTGATDEASELIARAKRLNPNSPVWYGKPAGIAAFQRGDYEDAIAELTVVYEADFIDLSWVWLISALGHVGKVQEAKEILDAPSVGRANNQLAISRRIPIKARDQMQHFLDGLGKAGVPKEPRPLN